ncbi:MAG: type II toxin-antitoxin system VapC family toxin [Candidatus Methanospirareceae archaeon]|jgi:Predicted nucleic acid-binding protein, contains PIN domain
MKLFIDTSIFIDILRTEQVKSSKLLFKGILGQNEAFTSAITVAELSVGAHRSPRKDALEKTFRLLSFANVVGLDKDIAVAGGRIYAELMEKGAEIELNDCLIAATSLSLGIQRIVTRDNHFNRITGISAITPEDMGF